MSTKILLLLLQFFLYLRRKKKSCHTLELKSITLFSRFDIKPEISRGEIRDLWRTFITNTDRTLEYLQFIRHFGFSLRSATFPNAKINPPRRGDADFMMRSRKLNCDSDMLHDSLRAKVRTRGCVPDWNLASSWQSIALKNDTILIAF